MVEALPPLENKIRWPLLHLADVLANSGEGLVSCFLAGSGVSLEAQDLVGELFCPSVFSGNSTGVGVFSVEDPGRYAYHFLEESGEWFTCNCLGGLSLSVDLSFSVLGWPAVLVASDPKLIGDEVANGHLLLLERSTFLQHVDVLLDEAVKNFVSSPGKASASSCILDAFLFQSLERRRAAEARREAALGAGDEDDRETLA